jgi:hypothetical protein
MSRISRQNSKKCRLRGRSKRGRFLSTPALLTHVLNAQSFLRLCRDDVSVITRSGDWGNELKGDPAAARAAFETALQVIDSAAALKVTPPGAGAKTR